MGDEKLKRYVIETIRLVKSQAIKAKRKADDSKDCCNDYTQGVIMGYYSIINLLKNQAFSFCIDQKELGLANIKPDIDLLGFHRSVDMDFGEDNWRIDSINEEKLRAYLSDSIMLLKEQMIEAKKDLNNQSSEDYAKGEISAYHTVIKLMKSQTNIFNINQEDIGLDKIELEKDL